MHSCWVAHRFAFESMCICLSPVIIAIGCRLHGESVLYFEPCCSMRDVYGSLALWPGTCTMLRSAKFL